MTEGVQDLSLDEDDEDDEDEEDDEEEPAEDDDDEEEDPYADPHQILPQPPVDNRMYSNWQVKNIAFKAIVNMKCSCRNASSQWSRDLLKPS